MKRTLLSLLLLAPAALLTAQTTGGISAGMLEQIKKAQPQDAGQQALRNAVTGASLQSLAMPMSARSAGDTHFSHRVRTKGITDQQQSGRCWLFTGLNVMRSRMITKYNLGAFEFSQSYCFFYDQLEKSNLFLQSAIDLAKLPMDDKKVDWLFHNPLSDGGTFCGVQDVVTKYGLVPAEVMPETFSANNTGQMSTLIATKLREYGLELRAMVADGAKAKALNDRKTQMLGTVYHMLSLCLGEPPVSFTWTRKDAQGNPVDTREYTPLSFYQTYVGADLKGNYVMLMNDPSRPYHKTYTIDMDRHSYDGTQWTFLNLPMEEIKPLAIASIKDSTMMYSSCDVGKCYNSKTGVLSLDNYDYASLFGTDFPMNKADRIRTFASASSHAMTLMAVDLDANDKPTKWKVENSWGANSGVAGHLIMTDGWFDEYMFRVVVDKKYVPENILKLSQQKPILLPAWDPLFAEDK